MYRLPANLPKDLISAFRGALATGSLDEALPLLSAALRSLLGADSVLLHYEGKDELGLQPREVSYAESGEFKLTEEQLQTVRLSWQSSGVHTKVIKELSAKLACVSYSTFSWPYPRVNIADPTYGLHFSAPQEYTLLIPFSSEQAVIEKSAGEFFGYFALFFGRFPELKDSLIECIIALPNLLSQIAAEYRTHDFLQQNSEFAGFAHDLKQQLLVMREFLHVISSGDKTRKQRALGGLERSILRVLHETNSVLLSRREKSGRVQVSPIVLDLNTLIAETAAEIQVLFDSERVKLILELQEDLPPAYLDPALFPSVVLNLLDNALKYSTPGSEVALRTGVSSDDKLCLEVIDSGAPIAEEDIPQIFRKQYRGKNVGSVAGHGIGLYLVERLVEAHNGAVRLEYSAKATKRFVVELPQAPL